MTMREMDVAVGIIDIAIGITSGLITVVLAMFTGGFVFFAPWLFWAAVTLFIAGFSRLVEARENLGMRVFAVNLSWFVILPLWVQGDERWIALATAGTVLPTLAGISTRRLVVRNNLH